MIMVMVKAKVKDGFRVKGKISARVKPEESF